MKLQTYVVVMALLAVFVATAALGQGSGCFRALTVTRPFAHHNPFASTIVSAARFVATPIALQTRTEARPRIVSQRLMTEKVEHRPFHDTNRDFNRRFIKSIGCLHTDGPSDPDSSTTTERESAMDDEEPESSTTSEPESAMDNEDPDSSTTTEPESAIDKGERRPSSLSLFQQAEAWIKGPPISASDQAGLDAVWGFYVPFLWKAASFPLKNPLAVLSYPFLSASDKAAVKAVWKYYGPFWSKVAKYSFKHPITVLRFIITQMKRQ